MKWIFDEMALDRRWIELGVYIAVAVLLVALFVATLRMPPPFLRGYPGDAFFPQLIIIFTAGWVVSGIAQSVRHLIRGSNAQIVIFNVGEYLIVGIASLAYVILMPIIGFEVASVLLLGGLLAPRLGWRSAANWCKALGYSVAMMLVLYVGLVLFLDVDMPLMLLPQHLGI